MRNTAVSGHFLLKSLDLGTKNIAARLKDAEKCRPQFGFQRPVLGRDIKQGNSHLVGGGGGDDQARSSVLISR